MLFWLSEEIVLLWDKEALLEASIVNIEIFDEIINGFFKS